MNIDGQGKLQIRVSAMVNEMAVFTLKDKNNYYLTKHFKVHI